MTTGTSRVILDELLAQHREVGIGDGVGVTLTLPDQVAAAGVGRAMMRYNNGLLTLPEPLKAPPKGPRGGKGRGAKDRRPPDPVTMEHAALLFEASCAVATKAVAATLIVEGERHPSGDEATAGRLVRHALAVAGKGADVLTLPLTAAALELCGFSPDLGATEEGGPPA